MTSDVESFIQVCVWARWRHTILSSLPNYGFIMVSDHFVVYFSRCTFAQSFVRGFKTFIVPQSFITLYFPSLSLESDKVKYFWYWDISPVAQDQSLKQHIWLSPWLISQIDAGWPICQIKSAGLPHSGGSHFSNQSFFYFTHSVFFWLNLFSKALMEI